MNRATFLIQDSRTLVGENMLFSKPHGRGYTTNIREAARYGLESVVRKNANRPSDIPWPCAYLRDLARQTVDFQTVRNLAIADLRTLPGKGLFLIAKAGPHSCVGNDMLWLSDSGEYTTDVKRARRVHAQTAHQIVQGSNCLQILPAAHIKKLIRHVARAQDTELQTALAGLDLHLAPNPEEPAQRKKSHR